MSHFAPGQQWNDMSSVLEGHTGRRGLPNDSEDGGTEAGTAAQAAGRSDPHVWQKGISPDDRADDRGGGAQLHWKLLFLFPEQRGHFRSGVERSHCGGWAGRAGADESSSDRVRGVFGAPSRRGAASAGGIFRAPAATGSGEGGADREPYAKRG